jgi:isocitrate dehydrogenase
MSENFPITVAYGDGIGPEIMEATLKILKEAGARITIETIEVGEAWYKKGFTTGIPDSAWESIKNNKILLKAPITTPQGGGYKSLNVTMRKTLGLYANVRPCASYYPFVDTKHPNLNVVIVRENEEDLYAGVEYRQTNNVYHAIKMITRTGCEKIIRYAFEYAAKNNRKKVTCMIKDNIMKFTDGIFHRVFDGIGEEYKGIEKDRYIIDIGTARIANNPDIFDVIVTENLYGDIISDVVAEISGSVGLAGSANIGTEYAMFEAIHGSAPDIAGKQIANPSGLLNGAIMMLVHIGQNDIATKVHNAWLATIEEGMHTADIYNPENSQKKLGTSEFADEVIKRLGKQPSKLKAVDYGVPSPVEMGSKHKFEIDTSEKKQLVGVDVSVGWIEGDQDQLAEIINKLTEGTELGLKVISSRGLKVWPREKTQGGIESDQWNLRFVPSNSSKTITHNDILILLANLEDAKIDFVKVENLHTFGDQLGFSLAQGE